MENKEKIHCARKSLSGDGSRDYGDRDGRAREPVAFWPHQELQHKEGKGNCLRDTWQTPVFIFPKNYL